MLSISEAYKIVLRCIKAIAGQAEPAPDPQHTLSEAGVADQRLVRLFKNELVTQLGNEGLEFRKMGIDDIGTSSTIEEVTHLVRHALPKGEKFY